MDLTITQSHVPGWQVLHVAGEIDIATAPALDTAIDGATGKDEDLAIDLTGVEFMDSTGLRSLIAAKLDLQDSGRRLVVLPGSGTVRRLFEVAGVVDALHLIDDLAELNDL